MSRGQQVILVTVLIGLGLRLLFVWQHPFTNDEGAYLFDAKLLYEYKLPGGDIITKAPVPAMLFAVSVWLTNGSLYASRLVVLLASLLTVIPLAWLAKQIGGRPAGMAAVILWLVVIPIPMQVLGITQTVAGLFAGSFLVMWWRAMLLSSTLKRPYLAAFAAGLLLALAYASRKTSLVMVVPAFYLWMLAPKTSRIESIAPAVMGLLAMLLPWLIMAGFLYGSAGVFEAIGLAYADIWWQDTSSMAGQASAGGAFMVLGRVGGGLVMAAAFGMAWSIFQLRRQELRPALPLIWLLALAGIYMGWPVFLPEYLIDFFIPIALLSSLALATIHLHWPKRGRVAMAIIVVATSASLWSAYIKPWTGMFTRQAIQTAAAQLQKYVPADEPIFTAVVIIPYLSDHDVIGNISHPMWYRYKFISAATRDSFLPPIDEVEAEIRNGSTKWGIVEHLTDYSYLRSEANLIELFGRDWVLIDTIKNDTGWRSNDIKIYSRS